MMKRTLAALLIAGLLTAPAAAQISVPNTLVAGTTIRAADLNTNFSTLGNHALDRLSGGTISGNVTMDPGITIDGLDLSVALCSTCAAAFTDVTAAALKNTGDTTTKFSFPASGTAAVYLTGTQRLLLDTNGLTIYGTNIINATGKIPAITATYFTSLAFDAGNLSTGTVATARLGSGAASSSTFLRGDSTWTQALPSGFIGFVDSGSCPSGFTDLSATYGGRYIVAMPSGGTIAGTVGSALTNTENRTHTHTFTTASGGSGTSGASGVVDLANGASASTAFGTFNSISSSLNFGGTWWTDPGTDWVNIGAPNNFIGAATHTHTTPAHTHTGTTDTAATGTAVPYVQLRACKAP